MNVGRIHVTFTQSPKNKMSLLTVTLSLLHDTTHWPNVCSDLQYMSQIWKERKITPQSHWLLKLEATSIGKSLTQDRNPCSTIPDWEISSSCSNTSNPGVLTANKPTCSIFCCCCLVAKSCLTLLGPHVPYHQAPLSMGFHRQQYWSGLPFLPPGDLPNPGIEPRSPALVGRWIPYHWAAWEAHFIFHQLVKEFFILTGISLCFLSILSGNIKTKLNSPSTWQIRSP